MPLATPAVPALGSGYMEVDPAVALSGRNVAETQSVGLQNAAFTYAWDQNKKKLPRNFGGDNTAIDAIFAIAQAYVSPPATPTLTTLTPNTKVHGAAAFDMTLTGTGFTPGSTVVFGTVIETRVTFISATSLSVTIYPAYIPSAGTIAVKVRPGGGAADSGSQNFTVT